MIKRKLIISTLTSGKHKQEGLSNVLDAYIQKQSCDFGNNNLKGFADQ